MTDHDQIYVGGGWRRSASPASLGVVDPTTEQVVGRIPAGAIEDVDAACWAAKRAFWDGWETSPRAVRADLLRRLHHELTLRRDDLVADLMLDLGVSRKVAEVVHVDLPLTVLASYADLLDEPAYEESIGSSVVVREPIGVVAALTPWNYPLHQIIAKVGAALAAGCTVVLKPSEVAPLVAYRLFDAVDAAGFPPGVVNLVMGSGLTIGRSLVAHHNIDLVSVTGGLGAGAQIATAAGSRLIPTILELGGKSSCVVLPDGDLAAAARATVSSVLLNSGQSCTALSLLIVPETRVDEAATFAAGLMAERTPRLGPLVSQAQWDLVQAKLAASISHGTRVVTGGVGRPEGVERGFFVRPTVLSHLGADDHIAELEVFGPVLVVLGYPDEDTAANLANCSPYGLSGAVWSADKDRAVGFARRMRTGQVEINGGAFNPLAPFGGVGTSGWGRELGRHGIEAFTYLKSLQL